MSNPPPQSAKPKHAAAHAHWPWWRRMLARLVFVLFAVPQTVWRGLVVAYFVLAIVFLLLANVVAPRIAHYKDDIAAALGQRLGQQVEIASLEADWRGLRPRLHMQGFRVIDAEGQTVLELPEVHAAVAWSSLLRGEARLHHVALVRPELALRRDREGRLFVAGLEIKGGDSGPGPADLLLAQREIVIEEARLSWLDEQRGAPLLSLDQLSLRLLNRGERHSFALLASPPPDMGERLDLRGDLRGESLARLAEWRGSLFLNAERFDLAAWQQWVDYPVDLPGGRGGLTAWLNFEGARVASLTADFALRELHLRLGQSLPALDMAEASGRLRFAAREGDLSVAAERLRLRTAEGLSVTPGNFNLRHVAPREGRRERGELQAERIELAPLAQLAAGLPLPETLRRELALRAPQGRVSLLKAKWEGAAAHPQHFSFEAAFERLGLQPVGSAPGFHGLSGTASGDERAGRFRLTVNKGALLLPAVMPAPELLLDEARLEGGWSHPVAQGDLPAPLELRFTQASARNADVAVEGSGLWRGQPGEAGYLEVDARAHSGVGREAWKYIPNHVVGLAPWLRQHLLDGVGERATVRLAGDLHKFPFVEPGSGEFRVDVDVRDARLDFAEGWPGFSGVRAQLLFERDLMRITAREGRYGAVRLRGATVEIPNLMEAGKQLMTVKGQAVGPLPDFQQYVQASALRTSIGPFIRRMDAQGGGELDLRLELPLHDVNHSRVKGSFRFDQARLRLVPGLPWLSEASATVGFTEKDFSLGEAGGVFLGARVRATGGTEADGSQRFVADGVLPVRGLNELVASPVWQSLEGSAPVRATIRVLSNGVDVAVDSNLQGVRSRLPAPLAKPAAESSRLVGFLWQSRFPLADSSTSLQDWRVRLDGGLEVQWQEQCSGERCDFMRGALAVGEAASLPVRGWRVGGRFATLDLDAWMAVLSGGLSAAGSGETMLAGLVVEADEVLGLGYRFNKVSLRGLRQNETWTLHLDGPDIAGDLRYASANKGRVDARLTRLYLNSSREDEAPAQPVSEVAPASDEDLPELPALDVMAEDFRPQGLTMGKLELRAVNNGRDWQLTRIDIANPDFHIEGSGEWRRPTGRRSETHFKLALAAAHAGATLGRLGHPNALLNGSGSLKGEIGWSGSPTSLDYPSLGGRLRLEVDAAQFAKIDTGLGRLLGVLSLQALPRRLTLDFRDIFSEGFAFDSLRADLDLSRGVMSTQNLEIRGPAAKVYMRGSTDVARETHRLNITVQPSLSEAIAVGTAVTVINPIAGVATYLAQKVLRDPVEKLFSFEYSVTGPWADPRIEKLANPLLPGTSTGGKK